MRLMVRTPRSRAPVPRRSAREPGIPGLAPRNKSIASCSCYAIDLEFHVRRMPGDRFAEHVFNGLAPGAALTVRGPWGRFTFNEAAPRPVLFLAYETGFPPIKSLIEHSLRIDFPHPRHLYWAVHELDGHYLDGYCRSLVDTLDHFQYSPLVVPREASRGEWTPAETAMLESVRRVLADHPDIASYEIYATGPARNMRAAAALLLARGLPGSQLHIDHLERYEAPRLLASAG